MPGFEHCADEEKGKGERETFDRLGFGEERKHREGDGWPKGLVQNEPKLPAHGDARDDRGERED